MKRGLLYIVLTMSLALLGQTVSASVNDFEITNYSMKLDLGRDGEQRSTLKTVETITAEFPETDQNHGIERAIPNSYQGHTVHLDIASVTDESGARLEYSTYSSGNNTVLRVGSADTYAHGLKTYVLTYTQRDVTRFFENTGKDEWYWNLNGTQWRVPIRQFSAEVNLGSGLRDTYEQSSCYQGYAQSNSRCQLLEDSDKLRVEASSLQPGENVTVALGFKQNTFGAYEPTLLERLFPIWLVAQVATGVASVVMIMWASLRFANRRNRRNKKGTIIPEYLPPKEASVTVSAEVMDLPRSVLAAQLIDLAVRGYIKIIETKPKKGFWSNAEYTLEIAKDIASLRAEEQEIVRDLFASSTSVGAKLEMKTLQNSTALYTRMQDNPGKLTKLLRGEYGLRAQDASETRWFTRVAAMLGVLGVVTLSLFTLGMAGVIWLMGRLLWPLTDKGWELRRYLDGLKLYIGVAETDRIKMLQSPEGAEKVGTGAADSDEKLVKLYEQVLPYAILFGQEKEWGKELGVHYEAAGGSPDWYSGVNSSAFNAAVLSSAISNFSTTTSYTSSSGSSSGGSSGGGFSGGGGGGGGGGGW